MTLKYWVDSFVGPGGIWMWLILVFGLIPAIALVLERFYYLYMKCSWGRGRFMQDLTKFIKVGDFPKAIRFAADFRTPLAKVVEAILVNKDKGGSEVEKSVDEVFLTETPRIQRYIPMLGTIANISTLLGLLGTIIGLIMAFDAVANVPAAQRAQALATGISVAMATTAFGLIIAIPLLLLHGIYLSQSEKIIEEMDEKSAKLVNILVK